MPKPDAARDWEDVAEHERAVNRATAARVGALIHAAENALLRLDREDAERRAAGNPAPHDGVPGSVNDQLRLALRAFSELVPIYDDAFIRECEEYAKAEGR